MASEKDVFNFLSGIGKLEPQEVIGLCKILGVQFAEQPEDGGKPKLRDLEGIVSDLIDKFCVLNRKQRREILALLRKV